MSKHQWFVVQDANEGKVTVLGYRNPSLARAAAAQFGGSVGNDKNMKEIGTGQLVGLYNTVRPEKPVKKFTDRETAEKRTQGILELLAKDGPMPDNVKRVVGASGERPGRVSEYAGKKIVKLVEGNPRKEGTFGHKSWESFRSGTTYETYIANGGRRQDLAWDLAHKYVKLEA